MKFLRKWMDLEDNLSEVTQLQKNTHDMSHILIILALGYLWKKDQGFKARLDSLKYDLEMVSKPSETTVSFDTLIVMLWQYNTPILL